MAQLSTTLENDLLNHLLRNVQHTSPTAVYAALYTTDPTGADTGTEVSGGSYARQALSFSAPSAGATSNPSDVNFPIASASWGTVTHVAIRDASSGGNLLFVGALTVSQTIATGNQFVFKAGQLAVSLQ
jgi:hypothetical protein